MPLAIDPLYASTKPILLSEHKRGYRQKAIDEKPLIETMTLHAYQLDLPEESMQKQRHFAAPLEKKFSATIKMLTKHSRNGVESFANPQFFDMITAGKPLIGLEI